MRGLRLLFAAAGVVVLWVLPSSAWAAEGCADEALRQATGSTTPADCRLWEMVSPLEKHAARLEAVTQNGALIQAAEGGGAIAYTANGQVGADPAGNQAPSFSEVLSTRGAGGWSSQDIAAPHEEDSKALEDAARASEYKLFSADLSVGLLRPFDATPLPPLEAGAEQTLYLRENASGGFLPLVSAANVPAGTHYDPHEGPHGYEMSFQSASRDLSHVVLSSSAGLTVNAIAGQSALYEWSGGKLQLVSVLPHGGEAAAGENTPSVGRSISAYFRVFRNTVSDDGSRVVWTAENALFVRDSARGETVQVDAAQPGAAGASGEGQFQTASSDGSRVFFTDTRQLTVGSTAAPGKPDLYVFELSSGSGPLSGVLRDLTVDGNAGESANVQVIVPGASEDGSYVYFAAGGALAAGAVPSESCETTCNLYVEHYDGTAWEAPKLIATVSGEDSADWGWPETDSLSRVSPNGRYLSFMSDVSLTGYDNRDASSGVRDEEVYLYDASMGRVVCASCDPSGARPTGIRIPASVTEELEGPPLVNEDESLWAGRWLAGNTPQWTNEEISTMLYQPRFLSDSGRLFFDSPVALVPGDVNGKEDVYEYEPAGVGGCQGSPRSAGVVFSEAAAGCVGLISSGTSAGESAFLDASASGGDVFFLSSAQLSPLDVDGAYDVYDAHECSDASPCVAQSAGVAAACSSADGCRGLGAASMVFGAPGSASFAGAGNVAPSVSPPVVKPKPRGLSRAQKLARALAVCHRKPKRRRAACVRRARKAYNATNARAGRGISDRAGR